MQNVKHDDLPIVQASPSIVAIWRWLRVSMLAALGIFVTFTALRGISESWHNGNFPEALGVKLELLPLIFPVHMVTGGLALLLVLLALMLRGTAWHRWAGRAAAMDILVAGVTAIPVALEAPVTRISAMGFTMQAITWLTLLGFGLWHVRRGHLSQHRACMLMVAAVTSGAMFFRVYLALWKLVGWHGGFNTFYACDAWIAWSLPLAVTAVLLKAKRLPKAFNAV